MKQASDALGNALSIAGRSIRLDLKRIYGTPEKAEEAIREAVEDRKALEMWASIVTAKSERLASMDGGVSTVVESGGYEFSFEMLPPGLREKAAESLAAAMLVWTAEQESGAA